MTDTANIGLPLVPENTLDPAAGLNLALVELDALTQTAVIRMDLTTPPGTSADGDMYIVAAGATGDWAGHDNDLAYFVQEGTFWKFFTAGAEVKIVLNLDDGVLYVFDQVVSPASWSPASAGALSVTNTDSPQLVATNVTGLVFGGGFALELLSDGRVLVEGGSGGTAESGHGTLTTASVSSNTVNLDHSAGADFHTTLTANVTTVNHNNLTAGAANWFTWLIEQDGTGGRTFAPPASWKYGAGVSAYTVSSGAGDKDLVQGVTYDDGTSWLISYVKDFT